MAVKILSVDDEMDLEVLLTQYFRRKIRKGEYEFFFANNGLEALDILLKNPDIEIVLSDINMPEMDGLTMLAKLNEMHNPALKCIMVSAYGDMGNIRQAMNGGAFDFATKPIDLDDLSVTIEKAIEQIEFVRKSQAEHAKLVDIQGDLDAASQIQQAILPNYEDFLKQTNLPVCLCSSMKAAKDVGGDFFDFFALDDHRMAFTIADVSGKGMPAALFMAVSRTVIRTYGMQGLSSQECMANANKMLCTESLNSMFVTTFYGIYDTTTGLIDYTNAGHNPPYVLKADGSVQALPICKNIALGVFDFPFTSNELQLEPGDTLVMYTDGVTEAHNEQKGDYGEERLEALLPTLKGKSSSEICDAIKKDVEKFVDGDPQSDDMTMLILKRP